MSAYKKTLLAALLCGVACTALAVPKGGDYYKGGSTLNSVEVNRTEKPKTKRHYRSRARLLSKYKTSSVLSAVRPATPPSTATPKMPMWTANAIPAM